MRQKPFMPRSLLRPLCQIIPLCCPTQFDHWTIRTVSSTGPHCTSAGSILSIWGIELHFSLCPVASSDMVDSSCQGNLICMFFIFQIFCKKINFANFAVQFHHFMNVCPGTTAWFICNIKKAKKFAFDCWRRFSNQVMPLEIFQKYDSGSILRFNLLPQMATIYFSIEHCSAFW